MQMRSWLTLSPGAADLVKLMALLAMVIDHVNTVLMPVPRLELYALGRTAFPLFTLIWAMHVTRTPQRLQHRAGQRGMVVGTVLMILLVWPLMPASYGIPGLVLALSLAIWLSDAPAAGRNGLGDLSLLALLLLNGATHLLDNTLQAVAYALAPTLLLPLAAVRLATSVCPTGAPRFMPGGFLWLAYPGHLAVLLLIHSML